MLINYKGTTFTTSLFQNYLDQDFTYEGEDFPFAIAMIDTNEPDLVPKQGLTIDLVRASFNPQSTTERTETRESLELQPCTEAQLGLFYDRNEAQKIKFQFFEPFY